MVPAFNLATYVLSCFVVWRPGGDHESQTPAPGRSGASPPKEVGAEIEEFDIEGTLAFAEHLVTKSSRLWLEAGLDQRQRLQKLLFPEGLVFDGRVFRTQLTCPLFNNLNEVFRPEGGLVEQKGFEPSTPTLRTWCSPS